MKTVVFLLTILACSALGNVLNVRTAEERIVGGAVVPINSFPWIVSIQRIAGSVFTHTCGGSILTVYAILSSARCFHYSGSVDWTVPQYWRVRAGSALHASGGTYLQVSRITNHPQYDSWTTDNDVSVLRLLTPLTISASVAQVTIPAQNAAVPVGVLGTVGGWGRTTVTGALAASLNAVTVQIINQNDCVTRYQGLNGVTVRMFCAGWTTDGRGTCHGDNGGPLIANGLQYGISSWGFCNNVNFPGVFASVPQFTTWIITAASYV